MKQAVRTDQYAQLQRIPYCAVICFLMDNSQCNRSLWRRTAQPSHADHFELRRCLGGRRFVERRSVARNLLVRDSPSRFRRCGQFHRTGCEEGLRVPSGGVAVMGAERSNEPRWWFRKPRNLKRLVIPRLIEAGSTDSLARIQRYFGRALPPA